jgi:glycerate 2-kinase
MGMSSKEISKNLFEKLLDQVNPIKLIPEIVKINTNGDSFFIHGEETVSIQEKSVYVIGTGKASASMAFALESVLGRYLKSGMVISSPNPLHHPKKINVLFGSHPYPDQTTLNATEKLLSFIDTIPNGSVVINVISGGTSSLFCKPANGLNIQHLAEVYKLLVTSGATIHEINSVRKSISSVKGGRLLEKFRDIHLIDLIISDVPDDNPEDIGSGPTVPQTVSAIHSKKVLMKYDIWQVVSRQVRTHIQTVADYETKTGPFITKDIYNHYLSIISSARLAADHAASLFESEGFKTVLEDKPWSGPIEDFEEYIFSKISDANHSAKNRRVHIFYGECTVHITGTGKGGRNQELALRIARRLNQSDRQITFLSAGTDGIDGPTEAAGAIVDQDTYANAKAGGIDPDAFLKNNDSYHFFKKSGGHIITGPTGNNVMDIQFLIID